jgi:hypothetical protein
MTYNPGSYYYKLKNGKLTDVVFNVNVFSVNGISNNKKSLDEKMIDLDKVLVGFITRVRST